MRTLLIGSVLPLILIGLAPSSANAENGTVTRDHYVTCSCQFGYPGRACVPESSCSSEGGRCTEQCTPSQEQ